MCYQFSICYLSSRLSASRSLCTIINIRLYSHADKSVLTSKTLESDILLNFWKRNIIKSQGSIFHPNNCYSANPSSESHNFSTRILNFIMNTPQFVIDTDVGSDDAIALVLCIAAELRGDAKILGITCVHGNTKLDNVCINTLKTLDSVNRLDIPVYRGADEALLESFERSASIHGTDGFGDFLYTNPPDINIMQKMHAVNYLTKVAAENPGEIVLLCLGPLTNIALAIRLDPQFCSNIKQIYIMGGNNEGVGNVTAAAEFNFYSDPEAAHVVIHNMKCPIIVFPWETAFKYGKISYEWRKNVLGKLPTPQMQLMNKVESVMLSANMYGNWHRCDPMTVAIAISPEVATSKVARYVTVELHGQHTRGAMVVDHLNKLNKQPNVTIVERADTELYKNMLIAAFSMNMTKNNK